MGEHKLPRLKKTPEMFIKGAMQTPLGQAMVIEALRYYTERITATPFPAEPGDGMINAQDWHRLGVELHTAIEQNFGE